MELEDDGPHQRGSDDPLVLAMSRLVACLSLLHPAEVIYCIWFSFVQVVSRPREGSTCCPLSAVIPYHHFLIIALAHQDRTFGLEIVG